MRIAILDDYQGLVPHLSCFSTLKEHEVRVLEGRAGSLEEQAARLEGCEALVPIRERTRIDEAMLERLPALRLVCQTGKIGPHLDLAACTRRRILVTESAGYSAATAELTWLLVLAAVRRLPAYLASLRKGRWQCVQAPLPGGPLAGMGESLAGKTLGVWGFGRIGKLVAGYGKSFGMQVLVHGREASLAAARAAGFACASERAELFAKSDVVTLHLRLVEATRGCVTVGDLARMKPTALLVNTSRAELVEPGALVEALRAGRPGLAAVDVFEKEPVEPGDPLLSLPNALCTPHIGFTERESYERLLGGAFANLLAYCAGRPTNVANPELLAAR
jgi:D-3-phosphoglycerate dehydrogenase / 2-oxoglutarate reductase